MCMYYESTNFIKGSKISPYTEEEVMEFAAEKKWTGGWVKNGKTNNIYYVRSDMGTELDGKYPLGSYDNPFSKNAYEEMRSKNIWPGGWVKDNDTLIYHRASGDTSGCGCGCGDNAGSGFGLIAGSERFRPDGCHISLEVEVTWGNGTFANGQTPPLNVTVILHEESHFDGISAVAVWDGSYHVKIISADFPTIYFNIPGRYRC